MDLNLIAKAAEYAKEMHNDQQYARMPYFFHLNSVASLLMPIVGQDEIIIASAYLHDIIEDTEATYDDIVSNFNEEIADIVLALTNDITFEDTSINIRKAGVKACLVKLADRLSNLSFSTISGNDKMMSKYLDQDVHIRNNIIPVLRASDVDYETIISAYKSVVWCAKDMLRTKVGK